MIILAHRGASKATPENTLASFKAAKTIGAKYVEFDVRLSKDNVPVVIHDDSVNRTSNGSGKVSELTLSELQKFDAGSWFSHQFSHETIPSLDSALALCSDIDIGVQIELKTLSKGKKTTLVNKTIESLSNHWKGSRTPIISSFCYDTLGLLQKQNTDYHIGGLMIEHTEAVVAQAKKLSCYSIHTLEIHLTQDLVSQLHKDFRYVFAWTVNDPERAKALISVGVDGIFTDVPDVISHLTG